jgi:hypothetical protein
LILNREFEDQISKVGQFEEDKLDSNELKSAKSAIRYLDTIKIACLAKN